MKKLLFLTLTLLVSATMTVSAANNKKDKKDNKTVAVPVALATSADTLSYAAGYAATDGLLPFLQQAYKVDSAHMEDFLAGFNEVIDKVNEPKENARVAGHIIAQMVAARIYPQISESLKASGKLNAKAFNEGFIKAIGSDTTLFTMKSAREYQETTQKAPGRQWLAENAKKDSVVTLPDGLQYKVLVKGTGAVPKATDEVEVWYEGKTIDGNVFDATYKHGKDNKSDKFRANGLIKGWTEALTMMPVGSKWEVYIPEDLAYGNRPAGQIPAYSTLIFTLELKGIVEPAKKAETPAPKAAEAKAPATKKGK